MTIATTNPTIAQRCSAYVHRMTVLINHYDCTNDGITRRRDSINVWRVYVDGNLPRYGQVREIVKGCHFLTNDSLILCLPRSGPPSLDNPYAAKWVGAIRNGKHVMAGGSYISTTNAMVHDDINYTAPISVHDRVE